MGFAAGVPLLALEIPLEPDVLLRDGCLLVSNERLATGDFDAGITILFLHLPGRSAALRKKMDRKLVFFL